MGRSVSTPSDAQVVAYAPVDECWHDDAGFSIDCYRDTLSHMFPSVVHQDAWIGREDHVVAGNKLALFGISEYCGLVAYWVIPQDGVEELATRWIDSIAAKFTETFGTLRSIGHASNGEQFFERKA